MRRATRACGWIVLAAIATPLALAGQPPAAAEARRADFQVVAWFRRDQPIATFQYQVYDVRKGDFTPAVEAWVGMMRREYPAYEVVVRAVDLAREQGPTEARKVGAVVHRELLAAAAAEGIFLGGAVSARSVVAREPLNVRLAPIGGPRGPYRDLQGSPAAFRQNPAPAGFPVPMPYPRPHP
ncbi:hypothetical protein [Paludisphaera mucosa]|uniref:Uncharacterized protein n=1 Tax=Paludisphaera mucosa TaxID=3030827 RepID=A0ABT6FI24_9BACT|nr:hypothetical protein [Paludisphaera mucosa]MDG3007045.1 hypothetical protein [Paludisphaera mucosa]